MSERRLINATCPECRGPLTELREGELAEYECLIGHRYTPEALLHAHVEAQERALWAAVVALEESENIVAAVAPHLPESIASSVTREAEQKAHQAARIREVVHELTPFRTE
jgi:two-component system, chemotaxis family, protein-glutamate methylesterase/glutaminase